MIAWRALLLAAVLAVPASAQDRRLAKEDQAIVVSGKLHSLQLDYAVRSGAVRFCYATVRHQDKAAVELMCRFLRNCVAQGHTTHDTAQICLDARLDRLANDRTRAQATQP